MLPRVVPLSEQGRRRTRRLLPVALALSMLAVVVAAGLLPSTGVVSAASSCTYGSCPASKSSVPLWAVGLTVVAVLIALIAALLLIRRSRRRPPAGEATPPAGSAESTSETPGDAYGSYEPAPGADEGSVPPSADAPSPDDTA